MQINMKNFLPLFFASCIVPTHYYAPNPHSPNLAEYHKAVDAFNQAFGCEAIRLVKPDHPFAMKIKEVNDKTICGEFDWSLGFPTESIKISSFCKNNYNEPHSPDWICYNVQNIKSNYDYPDYGLPWENCSWDYGDPYGVGDTLLHEIGHSWGLNHTHYIADIMYPYINVFDTGEKPRLDKEKIDGTMQRFVEKMRSTGLECIKEGE
jgi:hypothetical protein